MQRHATKNDPETLLNFGIITLGSCYSKMVYNPQIPQTNALVKIPMFVNIMMPFRVITLVEGCWSYFA